MPDVGAPLGGPDEFPTLMPDLTDLADVQNAFEMYHFGIPNYTGIEAISPNSMVGHLGTLSDRATELEDKPYGAGIASDTEPVTLNVTPAFPAGFSVPTGFFWLDTLNEPGNMRIPQIYFMATEPVDLDPILDLGSLWINSSTYQMRVFDGTVFHTVTL
jgi:hypothetical protein